MDGQIKIALNSLSPDELAKVSSALDRVLEEQRLVKEAQEYYEAGRQLAHELSKEAVAGQALKALLGQAKKIPGALRRAGKGLKGEYQLSRRLGAGRGQAVGMAITKQPGAALAVGGAGAAGYTVTKETLFD